MKDLLSKEHYCYKTHTLLDLKKAVITPPLYWHTSPPPYMDYSPFLQENLDPPF